jgi:CubicO group peptidase (beta-lactamase class C family)
MRQSGAHDVYFAWGCGGQYVFVVPYLELTVVMTSDSVSPRERGHNQGLHGPGSASTNPLTPDPTGGPDRTRAWRGIVWRRSVG